VLIVVLCETSSSQLLVSLLLVMFASGGIMDGALLLLAWLGFASKLSGSVGGYFRVFFFFLLSHDRYTTITR
jgi:hypothetical protein